MADRNMDMALAIAQRAAQAGGTAYFVGGYVRDHLLGRENKDIDIEVHGIEYAVLKDILESLGSVMITGASFGVFGLKGYDIDIAMPRSERATGRGHKDFEIYTDPYIGQRKAAMRRDFTMNAMMQNVLTGEVLDYFDGCGDMRRGIIRHVNDASFAEDPLRVLRAAQFAARFGYRVADETVELCRSMNLDALPGERVMGELEKALLKADRPSAFFYELRRMNALNCWFPELEALAGVQQNPRFHPEGDVFEHSMLTLDCAARLREQAVHPLWFMLAALCHDFGKATTTKLINGVWHAYEHEIEGLPIVRSFIRRLSNEKGLLKYVMNMSQLHMRPNVLVSHGAGDKTYMRMFDSSVEPADLLLLAEADYFGCANADGYDAIRCETHRQLDAYRALMAEPCVQGADLIEAGLKPGPDFKEALDYAHKLHLAGIDRDNALKQTLGHMHLTGRPGKKK